MVLHITGYGRTVRPRIIESMQKRHEYKIELEKIVIPRVSMKERSSADLTDMGLLFK